MILFPNAKINIGLNIISKRPDGYHNLESIFYPLAIKDALEVVEADVLQFSSSGLTIPGNPDDNLCLKAYHLLKRDFTSLPPVRIHLHKHIPIGAGLGGGTHATHEIINAGKWLYRQWCRLRAGIVLPMAGNHEFGFGHTQGVFRIILGLTEGADAENGDIDGRLIDRIEIRDIPHAGARGRVLIVDTEGDLAIGVEEIDQVGKHLPSRIATSKGW